MNITVSKRKRSVCDFEDCHKPPAMIVGVCSFCSRNHCNSHRLPEMHHCKKMDLCKKISFSRNEQMLINGLCVARKVDKIV
jgi:predicted nucleic acid binding AN1-type Zn finger protein